MRQLLLVVALVPFACSSSSSDAASPTDSGVVVDVALDSSDGGADGATSGCGDAPYVAVTGAIALVSSTGSTPVTAAKITSSNCPGWTGAFAAGRASASVSKGKPITFRIEVAGAIPSLTSEYKLDADLDFPGAFSTFSTDYTFLFPDLAKTGAILIDVKSTAPSGPCQNEGGITYKLMDGTTELTANIRYYDPTTKMLTSGPSVDGGPAIILDPPQNKAVQVVGTKAGCKIGISAVETGNFIATPGTLTTADLFIGD